jgi:hypothetical protein
VLFGHDPHSPMPIGLFFARLPARNGPPGALVFEGLKQYKT